MLKMEYVILTGLIMGTIARFYLLRVDYRQYPSYPQGYTIHLSLGAIAAGLGAVVVPAILKKDYTAITFLTLAVQQFREVRKMERESLEYAEEDELVKRGKAYIEDISKKFESRNYVAMVTALASTVVALSVNNIIAGVLAGWIMLFLLRLFIRNKQIQDIADVFQGKIHFDGSLLMVDDIGMMNVGLKNAREKLLKDGIAVIIVPKDDNARGTLSNLGQRQAIIHDVVSILGIRREIDEPEFTPLAKRNPDNGNVAVIALTSEPDIECMVEIVKRTPLLETSKRQPLDTYIGRKAAD